MLYAGGPGKEGIALIPVADMLDHSHERHMAWHTGPDGTEPFNFITHTPINKARSLLAYTHRGPCQSALITTLHRKA